MGKMLDPKNVTVRADRMMRDHLALFEAYFGSCERDGSFWRFTFNDTTELKVYYEENSRLLTKTFSITVKITVRSVSMKKSWKAKLDMGGLLRVEKVSLKALDRDSADMADKLNGNREFITGLYSLFRDFDLHGMAVEYRKGEQEMDITLRPYPGAFIWVKIPPIYYDLRLKPEEAGKIYETAELFSSFSFKNI